MTIELNTIHTGDARLLAEQIEDESVNCLFSDPVYENLADYEWLGQTAMRVLKDNSACLVWCKDSMDDECKAALKASGLRYRYKLKYACSAKSSKPVDGGIFPWVTPCLFFSKGNFTAKPFVNDWYFSPYTASDAFKWNKGGGVVAHWLKSFSKPGDTVFDPFTGLGSVPMACKKLGRNYIAFEIVPERAEEARLEVARIRSAQASMVFQPVGEQTHLGI